MQVAIILVNYYSSELTQRCVESLYKCISHLNFIIICVDNSENADEAKALSSFISSEHLVVNERNVGFGTACNQGAELALELGCSALWFLNNDTRIMNDALSPLVNMASTQPPCIVGSVLLDDETNTIEATNGKCVGCFGLTYHQNLLTRVARGKLRLKGNQYAIGASIFCQIEIFQKIGGFDENYFLYWEDVDLSRAAFRNGVSVYIAAQSVILHKKSGSIKANDANMPRSVFSDMEAMKSLKYFVNKNYKFNRTLLLIISILKAVNRIKSRDFGSLQNLRLLFNKD